LGIERSAQDENEPLRRFAQKRVRGGFAKRKKRGQTKAKGQRADTEVDIPDHARTNQRDLLAQREILTRQQALADPDRA